MPDLLNSCFCSSLLYTEMCPNVEDKIEKDLEISDPDPKVAIAVLQDNLIDEEENE